jgi:hypothetical protein
VGSSDFMWPYSYNECDEKKRNSQEINACDKINHYGMNSFEGRGAPEIDVIEAMQGDNQKLPSTNITRPYQSCSLQVAPGIDRDRPVLGLPPKKVRFGLECKIHVVQRRRSAYSLLFLYFRDVGTLGWSTTTITKPGRN